MLRQIVRLAWIEAISSPLIEVIGVLATSVGVVWLASRTFNHEISPSVFIIMVGLLVAMLDPIRKIANVYNMVQRAGAASTRVWEFLDQREESSSPGARMLEGGGPRAVRFESLTFRYNPEQEPPALDDVSLDVKPGECIAIVGPNGSGKSTLVKMLPRLLEPQAGRITIDGTDVRELSLRSLRSQIAVVSQRPVVFARTAMENIAYGKVGATPEEVRAAARQAYAAEFIEQWPRQYQTLLGEHGASVSGGQRQRIAIARAFLKPASIVIFDEATSEVDADSEAKIHAALGRLREGKTTFLIAHRHTVMDMAERIVVMDQGRIVDLGTHAELLQRCPLYVALYRSPAAR
jgi:subfamily B ATP-binding cassette protein MsbA